MFKYSVLVQSEVFNESSELFTEATSHTIE